MENNNDFLPQNYEAPKAGGGDYMKLLKGENKFRILSKPIIGWEDWKDKTPVRFRMNNKPSSPIDPDKKIKHFWAFVVWDYAQNKICILEITQATIQSAIQGLTKDEDWGSPYGYDIKVIRTGDALETEYTVNPVPHKPLAKEIKDAYEAKTINLDALFEGKDPFNDMPF